LNFSGMPITRELKSMNQTEDLFSSEPVSKQKLISLLSVTGLRQAELFEHAARVRSKSVGDIVYFRGLIEFSNKCHKNCYYCGIRAGNTRVVRYDLTDQEILDAAKFALDNKYGSIVLQSGEREDNRFTRRIDRLVQQIVRDTSGRLRITLSCGEQKPDVYRRWFESGAKRYLMRIETSNPVLYSKLHPDDGLHSYKRRMECLQAIKDIGYQSGTGVMIGLPYQTLDDLAGDLLFMKEYDVDMVGMGPYIEHAETPLYHLKDSLLPLRERFDLTLKMISVLRLLMNNVNIAATTALQSIDKMGREKALKAGANVLMPNITPGKFRDSYKLYDNKPCLDENPEDCQSCLEWRVALTGNTIAYDQWGDSRHFLDRNPKEEAPSA